MKRFLPLVLLLFFVPACRAQEATAPAPNQTLPPVEVFFSPKGGCTDAVVKELNAAKTTVLVQAYEFSSAEIAKALAAGKKPCPECNP